MATHSSTLAWKIPWTAKPGGLLFMGSHRVRHYRSDLAAAAAAAADFLSLSFLLCKMGIIRTQFHPSVVKFKGPGAKQALSVCDFVSSS